MTEDNKKRDGFGSKLGIITAAADSAIRLGICRFPNELGENGGAAFLSRKWATVIASAATL